MRVMRQLNDQSALKSMHQLQNSPAIKMIREFEESPTIRMIRELEASPAAKAMRDFQKSPAFKAIQQLQDSPALRALRAIEKSPAMEAFLSVSKQMSDGYVALTFSEAYGLIISEYENLSGDEPLDDLSVEIQKRAKSAPPGILSAEFYIQIFLALFLFYLSQLSSQESEERLLARMDDLEQTISAQITESTTNQLNKSFLVSDRSMNLRSGPSTDHEVIGSIPRNQKLVELERHRDWAKVEYFDHVANVNVTGWAHNRFLLVITPEGHE
ncbi:SH3 domain-containing protein [Pseudidiomarina indica]|uniref:SH3 domain-containing protein n=2 Tax=Pseudidiomarina indica TaxID=1159017 RepID=A0A1G6E8E7_9GAMM|nr:SH3 domain-containing protein [Pseudidiomarina indica]